MKKLILLFTIIFVVQNAKGQIGTDLQFSQTLLKCIQNGSTLPGNSIANNTINIGIVPAGKIWKVVGSSGLQQESDLVIIKNNTNEEIFIQGEPTNGGVFFIASFPIYFNENDNLSLFIEGSSHKFGCISIIEYTVIP